MRADSKNKIFDANLIELLISVRRFRSKFLNFLSDENIFKNIFIWPENTSEIQSKTNNARSNIKSENINLGSKGIPDEKKVMKM